SALPRLTQMVTRDYGSWEIRRAAALALGTVGIDFESGQLDPGVIDALIYALRDTCSQVRLQALVSLGSLGTPKRSAHHQKVKVVVETAFKNPKQNPLVTIWARVLWVQYFSTSKVKHEPTHFGEIAKMLKSPYEVNVRVNAAQALATLQAKMNIPNLIDVVKEDSEDQAALAAANALAAMVEHVKDEHIRSLAGLLGPSEKKELRIRAPQVFAMFGPKAKPALDDLIAALQEQEKQIDKDGKLKDKEFILAVIDCFGAMDQAAYRARPELLRLAQHKDDDIQYAAKAVLKFWNRPAAAAKAASAENAEGNR
ncbi:MAG TPA: HEAT repeat domain-containing protein, partial [Gemmataceae bacterium]|nr:HEAT repeat domain-containing protein [Gemmataceae bacterium]